VTITATSADDPSKTVTTTVTVVAVLPVFTTNPLPQVLVPGNPATFTAVASAPVAAPITVYAWERSNDLGVTWAPVGTNSPTYTTPALATTDNGALFRVTATNGNGSTTSTTAGVNQTLTLTVNGTPIELVLMPAGSFLMGQSETINSDDPKAQPAHTVTFAKPFYMAKYPVTQAQWISIMGSNPSTYCSANTTGVTDDLQRPVETVSFDDITTPATGFMDMLNAAATTKPGGSSFSLPSEAEFEYAIRAGSTGLNNYYFGSYDSGTTDPAVLALIDAYMWSNHNGLNITQAVGQKLPNAWGLFDMAGNVWSTCADDWHASYGVTGAGIPALPTDGTAWVDTPRAAQRAFRGGSFSHPQHYGQSKARGIDLATLRSNSSGFRVVLHLP